MEEEGGDCLGTHQEQQVHMFRKSVGLDREESNECVLGYPVSGFFKVNIASTQEKSAQQL